ncbi:MAG: SDR family NAD(P)-dependent oxidoreductase, partial [Myxococcales bacterium]
MQTQNPFDLTGKRAIVTGAAMGIGYAIAKQFVEAGARVVLADVAERAVFAATERLNAPDRA